MIEVIHTKSITINTCLWECSVYIGICKEFTSNLNGILQNNFHHLTRLNTLLTGAFWSVMVILIIGFQILRFLRN